MDGRIARRNEQNERKRERDQMDKESLRRSVMVKRKDQEKRAVDYMKSGSTGDLSKAYDILRDLSRVPPCVVETNDKIYALDKVSVYARIDLASLKGLCYGRYVEAMNDLSSLYNEMSDDGYVVNGFLQPENIGDRTSVRIKTLQAQLYEAQGYLDDALRIYKDVCKYVPFPLGPHAHGHIKGRISSLCIRMGNDFSDCFQYSTYE